MFKTVFLSVGAILIAAAAQAATLTFPPATITFDALTPGSYTNPGPNNQYLEDGFYYRLDGIDAAAGASGMELQRTPGAFAVLGSRTSFWGPTLNGGFEFTSIDWRALTFGTVAEVSIAGRDFQSGNWFTDTYQSTATGFQTFNANTLAGVTVDQLWIVIDNADLGPGAMDNLVLTPINVHPAPVPLPAAGWAMIFALGALAGLRRRL